MKYTNQEDKLSEVIRVRVNIKHKNAIKSEAKAMNKSMSLVIKDALALYFSVLKGQMSINQITK